MKIQTLLFITFVILCIFDNDVHVKASREIDTMLKTLNKPALKTIKSEDGDIIDCVDIYKQPAFDHPALKNHKIQMKPSVEFITKNSNSSINGSCKLIASQIWSKSGSCPKGTIPIRRVSKEDIKRASSPSQFGRKTSHVDNFLDKAHQHKTNNINLTAGRVYDLPPNRSGAFLLATGLNYLGAESLINVWNPPRVQMGDYSSSQIWLIAGDTNIFESIEAGWMVNPGVFRDSSTRLFTQWTTDGYSKTGCINLYCSGFVQTSTKLALGAAISPVSTTLQSQYFIKISIYLDPNHGNWWMTVDDIVMGYWPGTLFKKLGRAATVVQWGGEVYSPNVRKKPHTKTSMGSGEWANSFYGKACFHTNIRIKDDSLQIKYPEMHSVFSAEFVLFYRSSNNRRKD